MEKLYQICCPKCNNKTDFYYYGKDKHGHQKYQCKKCWHQWAPDTPKGLIGRPRTKEFPACPVCAKAMYVHHDREHYIHYTCTDRKCRHSLFVPKPTAVSAPSMSKLFGKTDFKRMRYPVHVIEISDKNIKAFTHVAKKYHVDFALKKDTTTEQPRYLVFFKSRDADAITVAFQEFASRKMGRDEKPSIRERLAQAREQAAQKVEHRTLDREKVKVKERGVEL